MNYKVTIRKNETQEVRECDMGDIEWREYSVIWWTDGNFGCDCNRERVFEESVNPDCTIDDCHCSDGRFTVPHVTLEDGTVIQID